MSDRDKPDYENSIKESITAVEAICSQVDWYNRQTGYTRKYVKKLEDSGLIIHSALKEAFNKIYGYTSDENGIRHGGGIGGINSTFEEARFMLVSCCAFVSYLIGYKSKLSN